MNSVVQRETKHTRNLPTSISYAPLEQKWEMDCAHEAGALTTSLRDLTDSKYIPRHPLLAARLVQIIKERVIWRKRKQSFRLHVHLPVSGWRRGDWSSSSSRERSLPSGPWSDMTTSSSSSCGTHHVDVLKLLLQISRWTALRLQTLRKEVSSFSQHRHACLAERAAGRTSHQCGKAAQNDSATVSAAQCAHAVQAGWDGRYELDRGQLGLDSEI